MTKEEKRFCRRELINYWIKTYSNNSSITGIIAIIRLDELMRYKHTLNIYSKE